MTYVATGLAVAVVVVLICLTVTTVSAAANRNLDKRVRTLMGFAALWFFVATLFSALTAYLWIEKIMT